MASNLTRSEPFRFMADEEPEYFKTGFLRERSEGGNDVYRFHMSENIDISIPKQGEQVGKCRMRLLPEWPSRTHYRTLTRRP